MRWRLIPLPLVVLLGSGCARSVVLRPGDVARPEIAFAPAEPWPPNAAVAVGMLIRIERPGHDSRYLEDTEVRTQPDMLARITFFAGDVPLANPLELPFVRDC